MKQLITTAAFLLAFISYSSAQGNLQFNQVIFNSINVPNLPYANTVIGTITVPAGKVWKVESTSFTYTDGNTYIIGGNSYTVRIGDHIVYIQNSNYPQHYLPLWLPEGTYDISAIAWDVEVDFSYSAIEFNVTP